MGVDLVRRRDSKKWSCNNSLWRFILDSASSKGWEPHGTQEEKQISGNHDPFDYCSQNGQTVIAKDAEEICHYLKVFLKQEEPDGIEKEIIESFLEWAARKDMNNSFIDIPGFIIR